jgi:rhodanese-related sulfurtransferase
VATKAVAAPDRFIAKWTDCYADLKKKGLRTVSPEEAAKLLKTGKWVLLDVRRPDQFEDSHPEGAVNVPMYRLLDMSKPDLAKVRSSHVSPGMHVLQQHGIYPNKIASG